MKHFTIIYEDHWQSGSHHFSMTKMNRIECDSIETLMKSEYGPKLRFIFPGLPELQGETVQEIERL